MIIRTLRDLGMLPSRLFAVLHGFRDGGLPQFIEKTAIYTAKELVKKSHFGFKTIT